MGGGQQQAGVGVAQQPLQRSGAQVPAAAGGPQGQGADLQGGLAGEQLGPGHAAVVGDRVGVGRPGDRGQQGRPGRVQPHPHLPHRLLHARQLGQGLPEALVAPPGQALGDMAEGGLGGAEEDAGERRPRPVRPDQEADRHGEAHGDHALGRDLQLVDGQGIAAGGPHAHRLPVAEHPHAPFGTRHQEADRLPAGLGLDRRRQEQVGGPRPAGEEGLGARQPVAAPRQRGREACLVPPVPARLGLGEAAGQDRALGRDLLEERLHPVPEPLGQQPDPVQVHVDGQGGRRVALGQPALGGDQVKGGRSPAAELGRDGDGRVPGRDQVVEVLVAERVGLVVGGRPGGQGGDEARGQVDELLPGLGGSHGCCMAAPGRGRAADEPHQPSTNASQTRTVPARLPEVPTSTWARPALRVEPEPRCRAVPGQARLDPVRISSLRGPAMLADTSAMGRVAAWSAWGSACSCSSGAGRLGG